MKKEREETLVELCKRLVKERRYSIEEGGVVNILSKNMKEVGFDEVTIDKYGNIIGCISRNKDFWHWPSKENIAFLVNEYIKVIQLTKVTECYYGIIEALLK